MTTPPDEMFWQSHAEDIIALIDGDFSRDDREEWRLELKRLLERTRDEYRSQHAATPGIGRGVSRTA